MAGSDEAFDPYRILGLPVGSGEEAIRRRYRELVREHHPDVSCDAGKAHERFVRIQQAYRVLMDPNARARWERKARVEAAPAPEVTVERPRSRFERLMVEGRELMLQRRYREARDAVAAAIELDPFSPEAYRLLGEVYMAGGNTQMCLELYREAELLEGQSAAAPPAPRPSAPTPPAAQPAVRFPRLVIGGVMAAACLAVMGSASFSAQATLFIGAGCASAFLLAAAGAASGAIEPFDELLGLAEVREPGRGAAPGGLYLVVLSVLSPYIGLPAYLVTAAVTESYSRGVLKVYAIAFAIALWAWLLAGGSGVFLAVAPSVSFLAGLLGWLVGSAAAPGEWWRRWL
ncbi:MAG: hypothetical protein FJX74_14410 [Armatimonadetes bacterium]|nr:hypothetical protein [Armatimonadota bacterium]